MAIIGLPPFGALLKRWRLAAGLTQEELAERAGLSARGISDLERGLATRPRRDTIQFLSDALALTEEERATLTAVARGRTPVHVRAGAERFGAAAPLTLSPLVGRRDELKSLAQHLVGTAPGMRMLAGEPGIGKTRLLDEAARHGAELGMAVMRGGCSRRSGDEPYTPIAEAFAGYIERQPASNRRSLLQGAGWLVRLLPELLGTVSAPLPPGNLPPGHERRLAFNAATRFLSNVAELGGVLLLLDDLQWAGPDALYLLMAIARSTADSPVRIVAAYRDTEAHVESELSAALADLAREGLVHLVPLSPLSTADSTRLLGGILIGDDQAPSDLQERILRRAGGVPFFLLSCAQGFRFGETNEEAVPWDVAQSIRQRAAVLSPAARDLLAIAAIAGRVVTRGVLFGVAARPEEEMLAALDALCQARLLEETGADAYRFVHDVIREVVESDLGTARRTVLHRRVAEAERRISFEPPVELLAYHFVRSDIPEEAIPYLEEAATRAQARYAHASGADYYGELVALLDRLGRARDAARACERLGECLRMAGRHDAALPALERAAEAHQLDGDREAEWRAVAQIGWLHSMRGTVDEGFARVQVAVVGLDQEIVSPNLAALYVALARLCNTGTRHQEELAAAERAEQMARAVGDDRVLATAAAERADVLVTFERFDEGARAGEEAARLVEQVGDLAALQVALNATSYASLCLGDMERARATADQAVAVADQLSDPEHMLEARCFRTIVTLHSEDWESAREDSDEAVSLGRLIGPSNPIGFALYVRGLYCLRAGNWDVAILSLEECLANAERNNNTHQICNAQTALAEHDLLMGRSAKACERLIPLADRIRPLDRMTPKLRRTLAWAHVDAGHLAAAEEVLVGAIEHARETNNRLALAEAMRVRALLATRQRAWDEAEEAFNEGLLLAHAMPYPYGEARLLHARGQTLIEKGEPEGAREQLAKALAIFRRLDAKEDIKRTETSLG